MNYYLLFILFLFSLIGFLYASVGHGGASGYLALMSLLGFEIIVMKQSALVMNLLVSIISFYHFYKSGHFKWSGFWPFAVLSIPLAYFGSKMPLNEQFYKYILAFCLFISSAWLLYQKVEKVAQNDAKNYTKIGLGGVIGLLSGMLGIGGGVILSPILILCNWVKIKEAAAISALFIFVNSLAGLAGQWGKFVIFENNSMTYYYILATFIGGIFGARLGSKYFNGSTLKKLLACGLFLASIKLLLH